ncbi:MAG: hypothetical protein HY899_03380 [Deltaproteobacteria bacterium]|nr:hypothetical protein [Deltaproteobacteria bacterium]
MNHAGQQVSRSTSGSQSDALAIIGMLAIGILSVILALVVLGNFLMSLPPVFAAAIMFSLIIFAVACGVAFVRRPDTKPHADQPPVLLFRKGNGRMV